MYRTHALNEFTNPIATHIHGNKTDVLIQSHIDNLLYKHCSSYRIHIGKNCQSFVNSESLACKIGQVNVKARDHLLFAQVLTPLLSNKIMQFIMKMCYGRIMTGNVSMGINKMNSLYYCRTPEMQLWDINQNSNFVLMLYSTVKTVEFFIVGLQLNTCYDLFMYIFNLLKSAYPVIRDSKSDN